MKLKKILEEAYSTSNSRPELEKIAMQLADEISQRINKVGDKLRTTEMPYPEQWILEELIAILKERV